MRLVKKLGDGGPVESFLVANDSRHHVAQISRASLDEHWLGSLFDRTTDAAVSTPHPELLSVREVQFHRGRLVSLSEPVSGWTAADLLARRGPLSPELVLDWAVMVCEALHQLHARGRVHGCLAPRHLHLSGANEFPTARLFDTELLHLRGAQSVEAPATACVVEAHYLSPERATGSRGNTTSDLWGVGALVLELLTGHAPFRGADVDASRALARRSRVPALPAPLARWREVLEACCEPLPVNRPGSALEIRQALLTI